MQGSVGREAWEDVGGAAAAVERGRAAATEKIGSGYGIMAWRKGESAHLGGADPVPLSTLLPIGRNNAYVVVLHGSLTKTLVF